MASKDELNEIRGLLKQIRAQYRQLGQESPLDPFDESKITVSNENEFYKIVLNDETHTIGNLLQSLLYNIHIREKKSKSISFIGYFVPHPLEKRVFMKIVSSLEDVAFKNELIESFKSIKSILKNVLSEWIVFSKDFS